MPNLDRRLLVPGLFLLALAARLPTLGLPLEGESAVLASVADQLAHDRGFETAGQAPLLPVLTSVVVAAGASATAALRWVDALFAALLAPLLYGLLRRVRLGRPPATAAGVLMALHPLGLAAAGGVHPGAATAATALLLGALALLLSKHAAGRRAGAFLAVLLTTAHPGALVYVPGLLWAYARAERGPRIQTGVVVLGGICWLFAPILWLDLARAGPGAGEALLWLLLAGLGLLLPSLPAGARDLWGRGPVARAWLASAAIAPLILAVGGPVLSTALLALVLGAGCAGAGRLYGRLAPRFVGGAVGGAALVSAWLVFGGLQARLTTGEPAGAGRLHLLREAVRSAALAAGERGWIVLAVSEDRPAEQASLADLEPGHFAWARRAPGPGSVGGGLRRLLVFPAASFEAGRSVAVVAEAGRSGGIETFDGAAIYEQEVVRQIGPYVVLRARRP